MIMKRIHILILACFFVSGCASKNIELTNTGFLSNYDQLKEIDEDDGIRLYRNESVNISDKYSKVMIAPVKIKLDESANVDKLSDEDMEKLSIYFYSQLEEKLQENYQITDQPGEGVIVLRSAITNLVANKRYLNIHWTTTLMGSGIGGASIEAEMVDSLTNERLLAFIDAKKGDRLNITKPGELLPSYADGLTKWGHTESVLEYWAQVLVDNLEQHKTN